MQAVKNKGSQIEDTLAKALYARGLRYRRNTTKIFGKPDFAFIGPKLAVFCDSEFWHGKDFDASTFANTANKSFWNNKIRTNIERDKTVNATLEAQGWTVVRFWGKEIMADPEKCAERVEKALNARKSSQMQSAKKPK